jgi:glycosyltransferase involved in cell wall biosynthesis
MKTSDTPTNSPYHATMKPSIVIPVFNRAHLIEECLLSIMAQTLQPWEVIAVNDGSTDATEAVCAAFKAKHPAFPLVYIKQANAGPSAARNTGMRAATGDFIVFWDSDDLCPPNRLAAHLALHTAHPELDVSFGKEARFNTGQPAIPVPTSHTPPTGPVTDLPGMLVVETMNIPTSGACIRRSVALAVGGMDEGLRLCEDLDFWLRVAHRGYHFGFINEVLAMRRMHDGNAVNEHIKTKTAASVVLERHKHAGGPRMLANLAAIHYDLGSHHLKRRDLAKAGYHLRLAAGVRGRLAIYRWLKLRYVENRAIKAELAMDRPHEWKETP